LNVAEGMDGICQATGQRHQGFDDEPSMGSLELSKSSGQFSEARPRVSGNA